MEKNEFSFEEAYEKLDKIMEEMNQPGLSLENSITLFEQAEKLIQHCSKKIEQAEKRIEVIVKNRVDQTVTIQQLGEESFLKKLDC